jgi:acyl-CoA synthetase (AMP-forming)/AMP-acid ligase II
MTGMTLAEAGAHLTRTDPDFAVTEAVIRGTRLRVFKNAPPDLRALFQRSTAMHGSGDYLVQGDARWSHAEFCSDANRMAHAMAGTLGIRRGDRVAVAMRNCPEMLIVMTAIINAGAVAVLLNAWWSEEELTYAFEDSGAKLVFADAPRFARIAPLAAAHGLRLIATHDAEGPETYADLLASAASDAWPDTPIDPEDDFALMYSSGTTGHPKGVVLTHRGAVSAIWTWVMSTLLPPLMDPSAPAPAPGQMSVMIVTPLFHVTATHPMFLLSHPLGARLVLLPKWNADDAARVIDAEGVTRFIGVPTQSADLMAAAARLGTTLPTLTYVGAGGAKRPAAQVAELAEAFPQAIPASGWGMTETNAAGLSITGADYVARPGVAGRLLPPLQDLRLIGDDGAEVPLGEIGELCVKSACNMRCYLNKPEATAATLQDGWLRTGDLATVDADGYVTIVDRKKSIIIRGGENISCLDVEGALHRHPDVAEAGVFPTPDARLGEIVGAGVLLRPGATATPEALAAFLAEHIAKFKIPERIWLLDAALPRGATDKIDRRALRAACLENPAAAWARQA